MLTQIRSHMEIDQQAEVETYTTLECTEKELPYVEDSSHHLLQMIGCIEAKLQKL